VVIGFKHPYLNTGQTLTKKHSTSPLRQRMIEDMISMLNQTTKATEIRDYPLETDVLAAQTKACTTVLADRQPSASIQSP